jgi:tetratricopeptide (TPR) repeat protein
MNFNIIRADLLSRLAEKKHFLVCAPSGFGKSVLLEQYARSDETAVLLDAGEVGEKSLMKRVQDSQKTIIIDNADRLSRTSIGQLISTPIKEKRFILALRHPNYPKVQFCRQKRTLDILQPSDLAFTKEELQKLLKTTDVEEIYSKTLGWNYPATLFNDQIALEAYLDDLIGELPKELYNFLVDFFVVKNPQDVDQMQAFEIIETGFPLLLEGKFLLHPLMYYHLSKAQDVKVFNTSSAELNAFISRLDTMDLLEKKAAIEQVFFSKIEDDLNEKEKTQILSSIPQSELTPRLRDFLIHYLYATNDLVAAQRLANLQLALGCQTAFTFVTLVRIANANNDFVAFKEYLKRAEEIARDDIDFAKTHNLKAIFLVRHGQFDQARAAAQSSYKFALRSNETYLKILTLSTLGYIEQMAGNLLGAIEISREAMIFCENNGDRFYHRMTRLCANLADMQKDAGQYEEALEYVQQGLHCLTASTQGSGPFLYCTRGLIYLELGYFELAIENFDVSIAAFEASRYLSGLLLPHTYAAYAAYRLKNWVRLERHANELQDVIQRTRGRMDEYHEYEFYQPLVHGLVCLSRGDDHAALTEMRKINKNGSMTYDSVLLNQLMIGEILEQCHAIDEAYASELLEIIEHRNTPNDCTVVMYRDHFLKVLTTCCRFEVARTRFERILEAPIRAVDLQKNTEFTITTLGIMRLVVQGQVIATKSSYPLQALVYLALTNSWVTPKQLGERVFFGQSTDNEGQRRARASTALNQLNKLLTSLDNEFSKWLMYHPTDGYRLSKDVPIQVDIDIEKYLSEQFTSLDDLDTLESMLRNVRPFQVGLNSSFNDEINERLFANVELAALRLASHYESMGLHIKAIGPVVYALRLSHGYDLVEKLEALCPFLPRALNEKITALVIGMNQDDENVEDLILIALTACEHTYPLVTTDNLVHPSVLN